VIGREKIFPDEAGIVMMVVVPGVAGGMRAHGSVVGRDGFGTPPNEPLLGAEFKRDLRIKVVKMASVVRGA
jgi:hypothetical protein